MDVFPPFSLYTWERLTKYLHPHHTTINSETPDTREEPSEHVQGVALWKQLVTIQWQVREHAVEPERQTASFNVKSLIKNKATTSW